MLCYPVFCGFIINFGGIPVVCLKGIDCDVPFKCRTSESWLQRCKGVLLSKVFREGAHRLDCGGYIFGLCPDLYVNLGSFKLSSVLVFLVLCFFSLDSLLFVYMN